MRADRPLFLKVCRLPALNPHLHDAVPLTVAAKAAGVSTRTARRWLVDHRADGAAALVRSGRTDRGGWRITAELVELIEGLALRRPAPEIAQVYRKVVEVAAERGLPVPSYNSVRRVIQRLDRGLVCRLPNCLSHSRHIICRVTAKQSVSSGPSDVRRRVRGRRSGWYRRRGSRHLAWR